LRSYRVFIGGPIQHALEDGRIESGLAQTLAGFTQAFERRGCAVFSAHVAEGWGASTAKFSPEQVTRRDYAWIRQADIYICVLPAKDDGSIWPSGGTHVELGWASALGVPILILWEPAVAEQYSHLFRGLHAVAPVKYTTIRDDCVDEVLGLATEMLHVE
jgi:nucleoside 2-deoxyribosyltransferase